jgi:glucose/arabinose dehydrogenase
MPLAVAASLIVVAMAVPAAAAKDDAAPSAPPPIFLQPVITSGLTAPVALTHAGDGSGRIFITEQGGRVRIWNGSALLPTPFLDVHTLVSCCGERGLLSVAFHPAYSSNGFFYVDYTDTAGNTVVARYHVSANPDIADPSSATILLAVTQPYVNHNGGQLQFGADGYLYIGLGDGGSAGDPGNRAQNLGELLGKILRIDVDSGSPYTIPPDNPFLGTAGARPEIWDYGFRNPWRFGFDRLTRDLLIGDVGQNLWEEVDFEPAGAGGRNYGWRRMEGFHCYNPSTSCYDNSLTLPILEYGHTPECSVTGGYRYRGALYPQLYGVYLYSDYSSGKIWGASPDNAGNWSTSFLLDSGLNVSSFGEDEAGEIYVVGLGGSVSRVLSTPDYAVPTVSALSPGAAVAGDGPLTLTVTGTGFAPGSVVRWNGSSRATTYVSMTRLTAAISATALSSPADAAVSVFNPAPGGGASSSLAFHVTTKFLDVPYGYWARRHIDAVANAGVSSGCGSRLFCPETPISRAQMAVFLLRAKEGASYVPPAPTGTIFTDVPMSAFAAAWIEQLAARGISAGCGAGAYCPGAAATRAQTAVFLLRTLLGSGYTPGAAAGVFSDLPPADPFARWAEDLYARGITGGCGVSPLRYCPAAPVTRAQIAVFVTATFGLTIPP